jgi:hypothetical protein
MADLRSSTLRRLSAASYPAIMALMSSRQQCRERGRGQDVGRGRNSRGQPCCSAPCCNFSRSGGISAGAPHPLGATWDGRGTNFALAATHLLRLRCERSSARSAQPPRNVLTSTAFVGAIALAGCTSDGTPASTGNTGSIGSFVRNLFGSKSEDQPPVAHNVAPVQPSAPKTKSARSKPKHPAVVAARAHPAKLRSQPRVPCRFIASA